MCLYCNVGDHTFRFDPPFKLPQDFPYVPQPVHPLPPHWQPWELDRLREYHALLKEIKEMEDKLGCPCEPNKADYLKMLSERIKILEAQKREGA